MRITVLLDLWCGLGFVFSSLEWVHLNGNAVCEVPNAFFFFLAISANEKTPENISVIYLEIAWNF